MNLSEICIRRPVLATVMNLALILFGIIGLTRLPVRELPDIDPPIISVRTIYPGASAEVMETQVTEIIEDSLTSIEGIEEITSQSAEQVSNITIEFDLSRDIDVAAQDVRDRVSRVRGRLPEEVDEPIIEKQDADARPSLWIALYSDRYSTLELTTLAENMIKDRLQTVPGVSSVIFGGSKRFAIRIWLNSERMAAHDVTVLDVEEALERQSVELPSGRLESWQRELAIQTKGELKTPEEYNNLVIREDGTTLVRLRDIGYAAVGVEDERSAARFNSKPAIGLGLIKQTKANLIEVAHGVKKELEAIKPMLPAGINMAIPYDESLYVEKAVKEVWETLGVAFALVVLTIYIFLHSVRATVIPSVAIPVSVIATFAVLYLLGYSVNIITMLAMVLTIGLVVDDAIVVLENIHRHIEDGMTPMDAAIVGMKEIGLAVMATTVALVAVFLPLAFQTTVSGRMFIELAVAISFSVIVSMFVALTLTPMLSARILQRHDAAVVQGGITGIFDRSLEAIIRWYQRLLGWTLDYWFLAILICAGVVAATVYCYQRLDKEFLPEEDKGRLFCVAIAPEGATSEYTDRMVRKMETIISELPEVEGFFSAVALSRGGPGRSSEGLAFIRLKGDRERHVRDIVGGPHGLRSRFFSEVEGAMVMAIMPKAIGGGYSQSFKLVLQSQDLHELNRYAEELRSKLQAANFLVNVRSTFELNKPELRVAIDRDRAASLGVSVEDISRTLQILFGGLDLAKLNLAGKEYDVIAQLERGSRQTPSDLDRLYIRNRQGELVQLNNIVRYGTGGGPSAINHFNRLRAATIEATPMDIPLGTAMARTVEMLKTDLPPGFRYEWDGEAATIEETGHQLVFVVLLAMVIIYMVLAAQFESFVHPFTIMLTLPLAAFGALGSLWLLAQLDQSIAALPPTHDWYGKLPRLPGMGLNLFSQVGIVLLLGLVTKNGILLVDFANQEMEKGKSARDAMLAAGRIRFRPIIMTALSTIAGILPIAIGFGAGGESRRPLGVAAVGGMTTSTFLTLFIVPVAYVLFAKLTTKRVVQGLSPATAMIMVVALLSSGCLAAGYEYRLPDTSTPPDWKAKPDHGGWKIAEPSDAIPQGKWWQIFGDVVLNELAGQAVTGNQNLQSAAANIERAQALSRGYWAKRHPTIDINPEFERHRTTRNAFTSPGAGRNSYVSDLYQLPVEVRYEIDLWSRVESSYAAGVAEAEASAAVRQSLLLNVTAEVARNYFRLRGLDREIKILEATIELRRDAYELAERRVESGIVSELDLHRAKTELAEAQAAKVDVARQRADLENVMAALCGQSASTFAIPPADAELPAPMIPVSVPSELLERRPDIAAAERRMAAATGRIGVARAAHYPVLELTASGGYESVHTHNLLDRESRVWSFGPRISIPWFDGGERTAALDAAIAEYNGTVADYRQSVLEAFGEVESALSTIELQAQQAEARQTVLDAARATAALSLSRYQQGLVGFLEVVDADRSRLQAELEITRLRTERLISAVELVRSLGGGWEGF